MRSVKWQVRQYLGLILILIVFGFSLVIFYEELFLFSYPIHVLNIEPSKPAVFKTSPKFLSIALDDGVIAEKFKNFDMNNKKLIRMMRYLSPAYLRIGGNLGDKLTFTLKNETDEEAKYFYMNHSTEDLLDYNSIPNVTLTASDWLKLNNLSRNANLDLFFGLNALKRFSNGSWDYKNAELMIKFSNDNELKINWELGNEPNSFKHKFGQEVNATQMAKDFHILKNILNKYRYSKCSLLVGPDVTRPEDNHTESEIYLQNFVNNARTVINKITWHQYYMNGRTAQPKDFLDPDIFNLLKFQIHEVKELTKYAYKPIWLGETSSAYGGGAPGMSDRFIGSFIWLDKLGLAAQMGVEVVMRQSIFKGNYSLLDNNYDPNPDWWVSLLYKKLVGPTVLSYPIATTDKVRLYAHCSPNNDLNSVVIFGVNLDEKLALIKIKGIPWFQFYMYAYELQTNDLFSKDVYLNGELLKMLNDSKLPPIIPKRKKYIPYAVLPPLSLVFWVLPGANVDACQKEMVNLLLIIDDETFDINLIN